MDQIRVKQATTRRPVPLRVATSSIDIRNVLSLFRPLLPLAARRRTCSSLRPLINYCATSAFGKAPLSEKSYYCGAAASLTVGRSIDPFPPSSFSLSRGATWSHISLVQNGLYVDYNYINGVQNDGLT